MKNFKINITVVLLIFVLSFGILAPVSNVHSAGLVPCGGFDDNGTLEPACDFSHLVLMAERIIDFLLYTIAMPLAAVAFAYAGFLYLTAGPNPGNVGKAKKIFLNVLWGLIIALAAWLIVNTLLVGVSVDDGTGGEADLIYLAP